MATAILLIDLQNDFLSATGAMAQDNFLTKNPNLQSNVSTAISHFRAQQCPVVWICSEHPATKLPPIRPIRPRGLRYADVPMLDEYLASSHHGQRVLCASGSDGARLYPDLDKLRDDDDKVFVKQYYSAFTNTGLSEHLRSNSIVNVVIAGVSATNCVLAAAADAFFNEFEVFVLEDCVGASSEELKKRAMEKMRHYGRVISDLLNIPMTNGMGIGPAPQEQAQIKKEKDMMVLYYVNGSIPSWRVMMMLAEYNIPYTAVRLKVMSKPKETRSAAFARINPRCKTPTLIDSRVTIVESMAILQYIERKYRRSRSMSDERKEDGKRDGEREEEEDGNSWITTLTRFHESENAHSVFEDIELLFQPLSTLSTHHLDRIATAVSNTEAEMAHWEFYLATSDYMAGDKFTIADCAFYPCLAYLEHRGWAFEGFPLLRGYAERVGKRESAVRARPEGWGVKGRDLWGRVVGVRERKGDGGVVEGEMSVMREDVGDGICGERGSSI